MKRIKFEIPALLQGRWNWSNLRIRSVLMGIVAIPVELLVTITKWKKFHTVINTEIKQVGSITHLGTEYPLIRDEVGLARASGGMVIDIPNAMVGQNTNGGVSIFVNEQFVELDSLMQDTIIAHELGHLVEDHITKIMDRSLDRIEAEYLADKYAADIISAEVVIDMLMMFKRKIVISGLWVALP